MENLIKQQQQKRVSFSGSEQDSKSRGTFKRDKAQNWFQKQLSSQMSPDIDYEDSDHATAIAAAAFAVYSADESRLQQNQRNDIKEGLKNPMTRLKTRKEDPVRLPEPRGASRKLSRKETKEQEASMRKPTGREARSSSSIRPGPPATRDEKINRNPKQGRPAETEVEAWERAKTEKIQKRYEKVNSTILAWENEKKVKAKIQMEREKAELEKRRAKNWQHYQSKLTRIDNIAEGARAQLEEKRKKEESKVQKRAKKMRSSGKVPAYCFCF